MTTIMHDHRRVSTSLRQIALQIDDKFASLLQEGERIAFDLENRCLVLHRDLGTQVARLSRTEAHLLLALVYFYPYDVPNTLLAQGYLVDTLPLYHAWLEQENVSTGVQEVTLSVMDESIRDGIERLRRKVKKLGMTIPRIRERGYALRREAGKKDLKCS